MENAWTGWGMLDPETSVVSHASAVTIHIVASLLWSLDTYADGYFSAMR